MNQTNIKEYLDRFNKIVSYSYITEAGDFGRDKDFKDYSGKNNQDQQNPGTGGAQGPQQQGQQGGGQQPQPGAAPADDFGAVGGGDDEFSDFSDTADGGTSDGDQLGDDGAGAAMGGELDDITQPEGTSGGDDLSASKKETEIDVSDIVNSQKEIGTSIKDSSQKIDALMARLNDLERKLSNMDSIANQVGSLQKSIENITPPTPKERLDMISLDSEPFNQKVDDYWDNKQDKLKQFRSMQRGESNMGPIGKSNGKGKPGEMFVDPNDDEFIDAEVKDSFNPDDDDFIKRSRA